MTLPLTLNLAAFSPEAILPADFLQEISQRLLTTFGDACRGNLALDIVRTSPEFAIGDALASARDLHELALRINRNHLYLAQPRPDGPPVRNVSAIFASHYLPEPAALGVMFDRGFETGDDGNSTTLYTGVPREACAIFVGAIRDLRAEPQSVADEIWFTTTHELGHLFNLPHTTESKTYLSQSLPGHAFRWEEVNFSTTQKDWLSQCHVDPQVWPGGAPFSDAGSYGNHLRTQGNGQRRRHGSLTLSIGASQSEFYRFEPIELNVRIKQAATADRAARIPNIIDPGYSEFRIWIETPDGQRRIYRPVRRYCRNGKLLTLQPGEAFARDISIFGESGGYTFRLPGVHKVWVELDINRRTWLRSRSIELNVKPFRPGRPQFDRLRGLFTASGAAQLLYHRADRPGGERLGSFLSLCEANPKTAGVEALQYALGRACLQEAARTGDRQRLDGLVDSAITLLHGATKRDALGEHRIRRANTILERLEGGASPREALWPR